MLKSETIHKTTHVYGPFMFRGGALGTKWSCVGGEWETL